MTPASAFMMDNDIKEVSQKLLSYCQANDWAGYDPYDALNSRLFSVLPLLNSRFPRLVLTQALKRCPINIRRFLLVPKTQNPKAIALFMAALIKAPELDSHGDLVVGLTVRTGVGGTVSHGRHAPSLSRVRRQTWYAARSLPARSWTFMNSERNHST
jgi:hypothetical protein